MSIIAILQATAGVPQRNELATNTAVLKVVSDILLALDSGNLSVLALLDLSAAFDSIDHGTLLQRLRTSYGIGGTALNLIASYLSNRTFV
jgi:hypothetical protein